jgi:hypothetical protein
MQHPDNILATTSEKTNETLGTYACNILVQTIGIYAISQSTFATSV